VRFETLRIQGVRCVDDAELALAPGLNLFVGANGAGKTSVLEAAYLLSHGRTFRSGPRDVLVQRGARAMHVYGELRGNDGRLQRLGLGRDGTRWQVRIDGGTAAGLGELVRRCAVVCFEPGSHALIAGPADERRRFLDWGVFHVEQDFLAVWRRYQRALKQRNALLRGDQSSAPAQYRPWERELDEAAGQIDAWRVGYMEALRERLREVSRALLPELGELSLDYRRGWDATRPLADELEASRPGDMARGHTTVGVHRADWVPAFIAAPQREHLSRGQEKLCALACVLSQAGLYARHHGDWPVVCLDDLASELDPAHQHAVVAQLVADGAQVLVTGTELSDAFAGHATTVFHVEQGRVQPAMPAP
jgi:DNA replication and repair protein RecF